MYISKISAEEKLKTVQDILNGKESLSHAAKRLEVCLKSIQDWITNYKGNGNDAFTYTKYKHYSHECKTQAVMAYLNKEGSLSDISEKFGIRKSETLRRWVKKYNGYEEPEASRTGGTAIMTKGRKTTFDERVEIASYCISHEHKYSEAAEKYSVSYQQARNYTVKFETGGLDALKDKRGKRKDEDSLTEIDRLRAELKLERAMRKKAEMEATFLKKLEEIERRRG